MSSNQDAGFLTRTEKTMKRTICLLSCISLLILAGCESTSPSARVVSQTTGVKDLLESAAEESSVVTEEVTVATESLSESSSVPSENSDEEFDIDLTIDNPDLIYAEVFAMVYTPEDYVGKTVKMKGQFVFYYDEEKDQYYYACLIKDAMACCAQGLEFIPAGDCVYPDDFPPALTEINVTGTFNTLEDDGETYCALTDAVYYW